MVPGATIWKEATTTTVSNPLSTANLASSYFVRKMKTTMQMRMSIYEFICAKLVIESAGLVQLGER